MGKKFNDIVSRLDTIHRDGRMDTGWHQRPCLRIASCSKDGLCEWKDIANIA